MINRVQSYIILYIPANDFVTFFEKYDFYMLYNIKRGCVLARVKKK